MSRRVARAWLVVCLVSLWAVTGCTEENPAFSVGESGDVATVDVLDAQDTGPSDVQPPGDVQGVPDARDSGGVEDVEPGPVDVGDADDVPDGVADVIDLDTGGDAEPGSDVEPQPDVVGPGPAPCSTNADCSGGRVCCEDLNTNRKACYTTDQCSSGGICETRAECRAGESCCVVDARLDDLRCATRCPDFPACDTNSDCSQPGTVCCPTLQDPNRPGRCAPRDRCGDVGGICLGDNECRGNQECCSVQTSVGSYDVCLDDCP